MSAPEVTIVVPCRNEEELLPRCLDSIIENEYPNEKLEVILVEGKSDDGTRKIAESYAARYPFIRVLENPRKTTPAALNLAVTHAKGKYVIILSAHARLDRGFVQSSVDTIQAYPVDCVGGRMITVPSGNSNLARAIARALAHPFGMGNSYFRVGASSLRLVDTVAFGCYRREVFDRIGLFDEQLIRNQDDEFNLRLVKHGGKILFTPEIISYYHARDSLRKLWRMFFQYGFFKPLVAKRLGRLMTWRQIVPPLFVASVFLLGALSPVSGPATGMFMLLSTAYIGANLLAAGTIAIQGRDWKCAWLLPLVFATVHFAYGLGYIAGTVRFFLFRRGAQGLSDMALSR